MKIKEFQVYLDVTIDVLKRKNLSAITPLKNFLQSCPSPKHREQILLAGILHFARHDRHIFSWTLDHQEHFLPELDILAATRKLAISRLNTQGWVQGRDFQMPAKNLLVLRGKSIAMLSDLFDQHELLLINRILTVTL